MNVTAAKTNDVKLETLVVRGDYCVRFFYHMYGADIGDLTVQTLTSYYYQVKNYFFRSRTQGDRWKEAFISVIADQNMRYGYKVSLVFGLLINYLAGVATRCFAFYQIFRFLWEKRN